MISCTAVLRVGTDPETRQAGSTPVVSFRGASNEKKKGEDQTTWIACSFFGDRATKVAPYIRKGEKIAVTGTLSTREYTDKNGNNRTSVELNVSSLELIGGGKGTQATKDADDELPF